MSVYEYLELQPIDPQEDGSISDLDTFKVDDTIDLSQDTEGSEIVANLDQMLADMHASFEDGPNVPSAQ